MKNSLSKKTLIIFIIVLITGCASSSVYKSPISKYQEAVNKTITSIQPYFVELNAIETEYQLYAALKFGHDWGTQHINKGIDPSQIAVRLSALQLISDYARLLAEIVNSTAQDDIKEAAKELGQNSQNLADAIDKLNSKNSSVPDFGTPLAEIVGFIGATAIQKKQEKAIETAVLNAEEPFSSLIDKLEEDLEVAIRLRKQAIAGITTVRLDVFNETRKTVKPEKIPELIDQIVSLRAYTEMLASINLPSLMREMKSTHQALVKFVKSDKNTDDLSVLAGRVDVFESNVSNVAKIIQSIQ